MCVYKPVLFGKILPFIAHDYEIVHYGNFYYTTIV